MSHDHEPENAARKSPDDEQRRESRRDFLKASVAGALALPHLGCSTAAAAAATPASARSGSTAVRQDECAENWFEPFEWNVGIQGKDGEELQLVVQEVSNSLLKPILPPGESPAILFSYNGGVPGYTIRMGGDAVLKMHLVNGLGGNDGTFAHDKNARFALSGQGSASNVLKTAGADFKANEVVPDVEDWKLAGALLYGPHQQHTTNMHTHGLHVRPGKNPDLTHSDNVLLRIIPHSDYENRNHDPKIPLTDHEIVGDAHYEFRLGKSSGARVETHPPGTHWYHPHPHGATYDQVATGMAGFLIVEGDVEEYLDRAFADYAYRERPMLLQRVLDTGLGKVTESEGASVPAKSGVKDPVNAINGQPEDRLVINMRPGAIERWRVLNGSVDGKGYIQFQVQDAQGRPVPRAQFRHLAFDGITLVEADWNGGTGEYSNVRYTTRPIQDFVAMAPANRADFLFQVPHDTPVGTKYKIVGVADQTPGISAGDDLLIATICVAGAAVRGTETLEAIAATAGFLPENVPQLIQPVGNQEITHNGRWRTRRVIYSGWGSNSYPCTPERGQNSMVINGKNSMVINGKKFDPDVPVQKMGLDTAEEWTLSNYSTAVDDPRNPKPSKPSDSSAVDHPFHIHQNPFWVVAIYGAGGTPLNANYQALGPGETFQPRWQDVVRIPRAGGQVVFRARFLDYWGCFVNHCHLLQHEDWGMMQTVEIVVDDNDANFTPLTPAAPERAQGHRGYLSITNQELESRCYWFLAPEDAEEAPNGPEDSFDPPPRPTDPAPREWKWYAFREKSNRPFPGTITLPKYPPAPGG